MKKSLIVLLISIFTSVNLFCAKPISDNGNNKDTGNIETSDWKIIWSDEFNETKINRNNWTYDIGAQGWGNKELEYYTDRSDNSWIEDGNLIIKAQKEDYAGSKYTSARLKTQMLQSFTYGKIEARIKMPSQQGLWPAFWMLGISQTDEYWPRCGEVDIMEHINKENVVHGSMHYYVNDRKTEFNKTLSEKSKNIDITQYHIYSVQWDKEKIKWFVDNEQYFEQDISNMDTFHRPFYIILNLAVGGNWPGNPDKSTVFPSSMYVDYVRVYNKKSEKNFKDNLQDIKNGWFTNTSGDKYYLDSNGNPLKGFIYDGTGWFYFEEDGKMKTGWLNVNSNQYYLDSNGRMKIGWAEIDGKKYYFDLGGKLTDTPDDFNSIISNGNYRLEK